MRRLALPVCVGTAFLLGTFGFPPLVNLLIRLRATRGGGGFYSSYSIRGTWTIGLAAAGLTLLVPRLVQRRRQK
jgi:hypothetical protein